MCLAHQQSSTQCAVTFPMSAIETQEQGIKSVQSEHKRHEKDVKWCCSVVFIVNFVHGTC